MAVEERHELTLPAAVGDLHRSFAQVAPQLRIGARSDAGQPKAAGGLLGAGEGRAFRDDSPCGHAAFSGLLHPPPPPAAAPAAGRASATGPASTPAPPAPRLAAPRIP